MTAEGGDGAGAGRTRRRSLLLVDDQPANVELLAAALEEEYELAFATTGERALRAVEEGPVDLVLLDVVMPGMDGYEVCRRLKARPETRDVPVIFVTSLGDVADETTGFAIGGVDYITKPASAPVVRARVRTHLLLMEQRETLAALAATDGLTGIANRRELDRRLEEEWRRALRNVRPLSVLLVDVDFFKPYNDHYGHLQGDACLRAVAELLRRSFGRASDVVARYGGEEFALVLPETEADAAARQTERILRSVRAEAIPHARSAAAAHVTVSVGAATALAGPPLDPAGLLAAADDLLYQAKGEGRDRALLLDLATRRRRSITARDPTEGEPR